MPIHGEYRMLKLHAELAVSLGLPEENTFVMGNGESVQLLNHRVERGGVIPVEDIYIDGNDINGLSNAVIHDRKILSNDGMVSVLVVIDSRKNELMMPAKIYTRGFVTLNSSHLIPHAEQRVNDALKELMAGKVTFGEIKNVIKGTLKRYLFAKTARSPMIIPVIMNRNANVWSFSLVVRPVGGNS